MSIIYNGKIVGSRADLSEVNQLHFTNPELTSDGTYCTWNVKHTLGSDIFYTIKEIITASEVTPYSVICEETQTIIKFPSDVTIPANTYRITILSKRQSSNEIEMTPTTNYTPGVANSCITNSSGPTLLTYSGNNYTINATENNPLIYTNGNGETYKKTTTTTSTIDAVFVGNCDIDKNGIVSGFDNIIPQPSCYRIVKDLHFNTATNWEINLKVHYVSNSSTQHVLSSGENYGIIARIMNDGAFQWYLSSNGTSWDIFSDDRSATGCFVNNTDYFIKIYFSGSEYGVKISTDGTTWNLICRVVSTAKMYNSPKGYIIGMRTNSSNWNFISWKSTMDFNYFNIKVNDNIVMKYNKARTGYACVGDNGVFVNENGNNYVASTNYAISLTDPYIAPVMTNVTNTNGILSNFVNASNVTLPTIRNIINNYSNFSLTIKYTTGSTVTDGRYAKVFSLFGIDTSNGHTINWSLLTNPSGQPYLELYDNTDGFYKFNSGTLFTYETNATYYMRFEAHDGTTSLITSRDGITWTTNWTSTTNWEMKVSALRLSEYNSSCYWGGTIDYNNTVAKGDLAVYEHSLWIKPTEPAQCYRRDKSTNTWIKFNDTRIGNATSSSPVNGLPTISSIKQPQLNENRYYINNIDNLKNNINFVKNTITSYSFPSNIKAPRYYTITNGGQYTAPADGWFSVTGTNAATNLCWISLENSQIKQSNQIYGMTANYSGMNVYVPVSKGQVVTLNFQNFNGNNLKFTYAEGSV